MKYIEFDEKRSMDIVFLGRIAIDFNPIDYFHPSEECTTFKKYVGGSPANTSIGVTRHGLRAGFFAKVSDDQFGNFVNLSHNVFLPFVEYGYNHVPVYLKMS